MLKRLSKNSYITFFLCAIFLFALFLRTTHLSSYPVGFQIDEASLGYNAYSILHTGKSEAGISLPLYIDTFGDNRPTGYNYFAIPSVAVFGLTVFATRLPGALFGALMVIPVFLLGYILTHDKKIAVVSSLLVAAAPWSIVLSRASAEAVIALFFILSGFYLVLNFTKSTKSWQLLLGTIFLASSFFFYHTPRIFVPLFFFVSILVLYFPFKKIRQNKQLIGLVCSFLFLCIVSFLLIFVVKGGTGRFSQVNIFSFPETKLTMEEQIREDGTAHTPLLETRAFHNKGVNYFLTFTSNYFEYFSGDFLFINGGLPVWYKVDKVGLLLLIECPFLIYGLFVLAKSKNRMSKLPLLWILVAPIVASVTVDDIPNINRAIVLFPMLEIVTSVGLMHIAEEVSHIKYQVVSIQIKYLLFAIFFLLFTLNFGYFLHQYFIHGQTHRTWYRNNGFDNMMQIVNQNYGKYDKIIASKTGGGYPLFLFFSKYDPAFYQSEGSLKDADYKGFGKYIFIPNDCPSINSSIEITPGTKVLYVDRGTCDAPSKKSGRKYTDIFREDGSMGFRIVY